MTPTLYRGTQHDTRSFIRHVPTFLPLRPVVEDHPAAPLIALAYDDTGTPIMHGVGVAAIQRGGDVLGDDRGKEIVPRAFPDAGVVSQRSHAVAIAGMIAADLAEWIRSRRLLRFRSHSRCGHPSVGSAGARRRSGETMNPFPTTAVCQSPGSRLGRRKGRVPCRTSGQGAMRWQGEGRAGARESRIR